MCFKRIKARIPSVKVIGTHCLKGYKLAFSKQSKDGSFKANIIETGTPHDQVWGVIHQIDDQSLSTLDKHEQGYLKISFNHMIEAEYLTIQSYIAKDKQHLTEGLPYKWYLDYVVAGAIENNFPKDYIDDLKAIKFKIDQNVDRKKRNSQTLSE